MSFHFYCVEDFIFRAKHLNLFRIKNEAVKIGINYFQCVSHSIETNGEYECAVIILSEPLKYIPEKYYEVDKQI